MKKLFRSESDKKIAGICGGIGEAYIIDSNLVRVALLFLGLATGGIPFLIAYLVGWIIIPTGSQPAE